MPKLIQQADRFDSRASVLVAMGTPLSVRLRFGQSIFLALAREYRLRPDDLRRQQPLAAQQIPAVVVGHRQRIAVDPVAGLELALEVRAPQIVRGEYPACSGPDDRSRRRSRFFGTIPWRFRISNTVVRAGRSQLGGACPTAGAASSRPSAVTPTSSSSASTMCGSLVRTRVRSSRSCLESCRPCSR